MNPQLTIGWFTFLLTAAAGFCDTATFVAGNETFSAHVTGNFIIFAAQAVLSRDPSAWIKLLTFPVFVFAVMTGGWLSNKTGKRYPLLLIEAVILLLAGGLAFGTASFPAGNMIVVMLTVFGMGLQNAFGKLFAKETYGPTTMMTGNVTQAALDLGRLIWKGPGTAPIAAESIKKQVVLLGGFLAGCLLGGLLSKAAGLPAMLLPGLTVLLCYLLGGRLL
ncbi:MAG TPA: YoaK family protein [Puia sp.]|nr:YoaK family protein [Puia sp.]